MEETLEKLSRITPDEEFRAGTSLFRDGLVTALESEGGLLRYIVHDTPRRTVSVNAIKLGGRCSCDFFVNVHRPCRHLVAALQAANASGALEETRRKTARANAASLLDAVHSTLPNQTSIALEITLQVLGEREPLRVALRIGKERLYVVKSVSQLLDALKTGQSIPFGKGFTLEPEWMTFEAKDKQIMKLLQDIAYVNTLEGKLPQTGPDAKYLLIPERFAPDLLKLLDETRFRVTSGEETFDVRGILHGRVDLSFLITGSGREIEISAAVPSGLRLLDPEGHYALCDKDILCLGPDQKDFIRVICRTGRDGKADFRYGPNDIGRVMSELLPELEQAGDVRIDGALASRIIHRSLTVRLYFDREGNSIVCKPLFVYGNDEINPFSREQSLSLPDNILMFRDAKSEHRVLDILAEAGFRIHKNKVLLDGQDAVYTFLTEGIREVGQYAEIYCSEAFKKITPRRPHFSGTLRMQEGSLWLELADNGEPTPEVLSILQALRDKRRYFRLKDGSFLDLSDMDEWQEAAEAAIGNSVSSEPGFEDQTDVEISACRSMYLVSLLSQSELPIEQDEQSKRFSDPESVSSVPCPEPLDGLLRSYQLRGYHWLRTMYDLRLGGILADDMGLGKTLQTIALLLSVKRTEQKHLPSIIVVPTTLVYNWKSEFKKFAPEIKVLQSDGSAADRQKLIMGLSSPDCDVDVFITSYPLVRRDIGLLQKIPFRLAILDEAQYIKNAMSVGSAAVRHLQAEARFALTGTPMENHPGELWSIFDFVLPGYLLSFAQFMHRFGEGQNMDVLHRKIRPFLLRRLKEEVLEDLPEKVEMTLMADMTPEQRNVYHASLLRLKPNLENLLEPRNHIAVLAAITELRQICGHPSLVQVDYAASSGKVELLMDILPDALEAGHRALLFSPFTGMLKVLQRRLENAGIECLYLDGDTPTRQRMQLVDDFNNGQGQIFLISLKAGGSGLNLVGADMVIHFDPWWNPAVEDQATDRAHRIGQKRSVSVIRLITRGSIEEQMVKLGDRKRELFDQMITSGEALPTHLSQEDIRALFDESETL